MKILPYKLSTTNDLLTSRGGLLIVADLMNTLSLDKHINQYFPQPKSNRGFLPSDFIQSLILMQHEGSFHLDDISHLHNDEALRKVLTLDKLPKATTLGDWLRRIGHHTGITDAWVKVNQVPLQAALHNRKKVTLDIDATEIISNKVDAKWTYNKNKGFMPMVGHIAEVGQVVAIDFRTGNTSPSKDNLEFIQQCQRSLPKDCTVNALRIDAAGYQSKIIEYCDDQNIDYAIRARTSATIRSQISAMKETDWEPLRDKQGNIVEGQDTCRTTHCIGDYRNAFTLVIQRKAIQGQAELDLEGSEDGESVNLGGYSYRAIATNRDTLTNSQIIHWYNLRAEDSENRIKELKLDFGGDTLPCSDFKANALYFLITALSYNIFALMRQLLPESLAHRRAITIRWRVYAIAAKVVKTGRQWKVKLKEQHRKLLEQLLFAVGELDPPPI